MHGLDCTSLTAIVIFTLFFSLTYNECTYVWSSEVMVMATVSLLFKVSRLKDMNAVDLGQCVWGLCPQSGFGLDRRSQFHETNYSSTRSTMTLQAGRPLITFSVSKD